MRPSSRWTYLAGIGVGIALVATACSSAATATTSVLGATSAPPAVTTAAGATSLMVGTNTSPSLGAYLTGQNGMTLYVLTKDSPNMSTCTGSCSSNWPPLTVASSVTVSGPAAATDTFGTMTRSDGTTQVTYNHMPLYYFSGDSAAGDANGEGKLGVWFVAPVSGTVMSPAGSAAPASPASASPASSSNYGGY
jgi:predicted lipoprotein with Yx(FWY)xxD motif